MEIVHAPFRFDQVGHEYIDLATGNVLPHITGLLKAAGLVDDQFYTAASRDRGTAVHKLCADWDLGAIEPKDLPGCTSVFKGWLLAHVKAMGILRPEILTVEEPRVHPSPLKFGGRPDRVVRINGLLSVLEIKSGAPEKCHGVQTALQSMLESHEYGIPAKAFARFALYLSGNGRFKLEEFKDARDFDTALSIVKRFCA